MKRCQFPTLPCLVATAILAVLLAIGFTMPFAAEAMYPGGWSGLPDLEKQIVWPDPKLEPIGGFSFLKDDVPFGLPRPEPEDQFGKTKVVGLSRKALKPDGPYLDDTLVGKPGGRHLDESTAFMKKLGDWPNAGTRPPEPALDKIGVIGAHDQGYDAPWYLIWAGRVLSPKPPRADDEFVGFPPKPKAKIVMLGGGIGRDY